MFIKEKSYFIHIFFSWSTEKPLKKLVNFKFQHKLSTLKVKKNMIVTPLDCWYVFSETIGTTKFSKQKFGKVYYF